MERGSSIGPTATRTSSAGAGSGGSRSAATFADDDLFSAEEMTTIIPIDDSTAPAWESDSSWQSDYADYWTRTYRPTQSEITQDILLPESEFEQYEPDEPFELDGAHLDTYGIDSSGELRLPTADEKPFRTVERRGSRRGGRHRVAAPPTALKGGRAALVAMAAGAAVAAVAQVGSSDSGVTPTNAATVTDPAAGTTVDLGPGVAAATPSQDLSGFTSQLAVGKQMADAAAAAEAAARAPKFASPLPLGEYSFTSAFASRWGTFHGGIDMAAPLGTPIHAASDGVVKVAGPASGYGNWIQILADDGTITMYGHMSSSGVLVQEGQHVTAGDIIGLVGNEGFSFGPHVHFEVWKNGSTKIDPVPWLTQRGVRVANYTG